MRMKRLAILFLGLMLMVALSACAGGLPAVATQPPVRAASAAPAPSPAPTAPPVIAVFGAEDAAAFQEGVTEAAKDGGIEIRFVSGGLDALASHLPENASAAIVYLAEATSSLPQAQVPIYAFAAAGQPIPDAVPHLVYSNDGEAELALEHALSYPPHLSPVRMIGLFSTESSPAFALWSNAKTTGRVFAKMEFYLDTAETPLESWLLDAFSSYYPGMLDAVYAETGALAIAAAETLAGLGRDDIEVFSAGADSAVAQKLSPILICAVGSDEKEAGVRCFEGALSLLLRGAAQSDVLPPKSFWYSDKP